MYLFHGCFEISYVITYEGRIQTLIEHIYTIQKANEIIYKNISMRKKSHSTQKVIKFIYYICGSNYYLIKISK